MKSPTFGCGASQNPWFKISASASCSLIQSLHLPSPAEQNDWPSKILGLHFQGPLCSMTTLSRLESWLAVIVKLHGHSKTLCSPPSGLYCHPDLDAQSVSVNAEHWLLPESAKAPSPWSL